MNTHTAVNVVTINVEAIADLHPLEVAAIVKEALAADARIGSVTLTTSNG